MIDMAEKNRPFIAANRGSDSWNGKSHEKN